MKLELIVSLALVALLAGIETVETRKDAKDLQKSAIEKLDEDAPNCAALGWAAGYGSPWSTLIQPSQDTKEDCANLCVIKKKDDPEINGVTYVAEGDGWLKKFCACNRNMVERVSSNEKYISSFLSCSTTAKPTAKPDYKNEQKAKCVDKEVDYCARLDASICQYSSSIPKKCPKKCNACPKPTAKPTVNPAYKNTEYEKLARHTKCLRSQEIKTEEECLHAASWLGIKYKHWWDLKYMRSHETVPVGCNNYYNGDTLWFNQPRHHGTKSNAWQPICKKIHPCAKSHGCQHICDKVGDHFQCLCNGGFHLANDLKSCVKGVKKTAPHTAWQVGDGFGRHGEDEVEGGRGLASKEDCLVNCIELKKTDHPLINGAVFGVKNGDQGTCWCEIKMIDVHAGGNSANWITARIPEWQLGDGKGEDEVDGGRGLASKEDCLLSCIEKQRNSHPKINGAVFGVKNGEQGTCYCEIKMTEMETDGSSANWITTGIPPGN